MTAVATIDAWWDRMRLEPERPRPTVRSMLPLCDVLGYAAALLREPMDRMFRDLGLAAEGRSTPEKLRQEQRRRERLESAAREMGLL